MKPVRTSLLFSALVLLALFGQESRAVDIDFDTYAAVAYSPATGKYGYAHKYRSRAAAEQAAPSECTEKDARIVGWVKAGWLALAIGDINAYGVAWEYGDGAANTVAKDRARQECRDRKGKITVVICICSGNVRPEIIK